MYILSHEQLALEGVEPAPAQLPGRVFMAETCGQQEPARQQEHRAAEKHVRLGPLTKLQLVLGITPEHAADNLNMARNWWQHAQDRCSQTCRKNSSFV